jgi:hypothetical protein
LIINRESSIKFIYNLSILNIRRNKKEIKKKLFEKPFKTNKKKIKDKK